MQVDDLPADVQPQAQAGDVVAVVGLVEALEDVLSALGRSPAPVASRLPVPVERPLHETVINLDEVVTALDPTRFAALLD